MRLLFISILISILCLSCENQSKPVDLSQAPEISVIDTDFSKGQLDKKQKIKLEDLVKFHGHLCDGLVVGHLGLNEALKKLYPKGETDRTNTRIISKSSPCLTDAAVYLTGGRYQFNTFYVDNSIDGLYQIQRIDSKKAVQINLKSGVKPNIIDSLGKLAVQKKLDFDELRHLKKIEDDFSKKLLNSDASEIFSVTRIDDMDWNPKIKHDYSKTDVLNKDVDDD